MVGGAGGRLIEFLGVKRRIRGEARTLFKILCLVYDMRRRVVILMIR